MMPRHVEVFYCDDIRQEIGNKQSFIGVYSGDLIVNEMPTLLPKLCIFVNVVTPQDSPFSTLNVKILFNEQVIVESGDLVPSLENLPPPEDSELDINSQKLMGFNLNFVLSPLHIAKESKIRVVAETEDGDLIGRGLKLLRAEPAHNESDVVTH